jgi:hypothetical protein
MRTHGPYTHSEMAVLAIMALALAAVLPHAAAVTAPAARAVRAPALDALQRSSAPRHGLRLESAVDADGLAHARLLLRSAPAAVANFSDGVARPSGYGQLRVWTDPSMKPHIQFYAAGFAEVRWPPSSQFSPPPLAACLCPGRVSPWAVLTTAAAFTRRAVVNTVVASTLMPQPHAPTPCKQ